MRPLEQLLPKLLAMMQEDWNRGRVQRDRNIGFWQETHWDDTAKRLAGRLDECMLVAPTGQLTGMAILHMLLHSLVRKCESHGGCIFALNSRPAILILSQRCSEPEPSRSSDLRY